MMPNIGVVLLSLYGLATAVGGVASLRGGQELGLSRIQGGIFTLLGVAVLALSLLPAWHGWLWMAGLASLLARVWNGRVMGGVKPSHLVLFGGVLFMGLGLTYLK